MPIHFKNNPMNDIRKIEIQKNLFQQNLNIKFHKEDKPLDSNENKKKDNSQEENQNIPLIKQNLFQRFENIHNHQKINKRLNSKLSPLKEEIHHDKFHKSNNLLPLVQKGNKKILNKTKEKHLSHNKSGGNIKINIDCAIKKQLIDNNIKLKNLNNQINKNVEFINDIVNNSENNIIKIRNMPIKKQKKLIEYYYKEEPNLHNNKSMEDFIFIKSPFLSIKRHNLSLFALFDGHGGKDVAEYLKNNIGDVLIKIIRESEEFNLIDIIKKTIVTIDKDIEKLPNVKECGSTGTIILIDNDIVYCANVGDSKAYIIIS